MLNPGIANSSPGTDYHENNVLAHACPARARSAVPVAVGRVEAGALKRVDA